MMLRHLIVFPLGTVEGDFPAGGFEPSGETFDPAWVNFTRTVGEENSKPDADKYSHPSCSPTVETAT